jgi:hypothetical protein
VTRIRRRRRRGQEASQARESAEQALADTRARRPEIDAVADSLRSLRRRNHFAEQIELLIRGGT